MVSREFYKSLLRSPIEGWIAVRGTLAEGRLVATKIVHSELNGAYDDMALELANNLQILDFPHVETLRLNPAIFVHLLLYQLADAKLALSFPQVEGAGGSQMHYYGAAWMAFQKPNHPWVTVEPRVLEPHELRGPRTYSIGILSPGPRLALPRAQGHVLRRAR